MLMSVLTEFSLFCISLIDVMDMFGFMIDFEFEEFTRNSGSTFHFECMLFGIAHKKIHANIKKKKHQKRKLDLF